MVAPIPRWSLPAGLMISAAVFLAMAGPVLALATEHFGNAPVPAGFASLLSKEELAVANLASRVYWYEVNANPTFYYRGNTAALNEALRKFATIRSPFHQVILLPGPADMKNLAGDRGIACD